MSGLTALRRMLRPVRKGVRDLSVMLRELPFRVTSPTKCATSDWLIHKEVTYGGLVTDVERKKVSEFDARSPAQLQFGGMTGGDRMLHNGYAPVYARYLSFFHTQQDVRLAEFGILKGSGLAIWCDLFPHGRILGLDIDLSHYQGNVAFLRRRGAFKRNHPELYEYDQLTDGHNHLAEILKDSSLDIVIDDGLHTLPAILATWRSVCPFLADKFVYFIEDCPGLSDKLGEEFHGFDVRSFGPMTVISRGLELAGGPCIESSGC